MRRPHTVALALLAALCGLAGAREERARSSSEFLQLLSSLLLKPCSGEATIQLASGVAVSQAAVAAAGLALPLAVPPGCSLKIRGGTTRANGRRNTPLGAAAAACRLPIRPDPVPPAREAAPMLPPLPCTCRGRGPARVRARGVQ